MMSARLSSLAAALVLFGTIPAGAFAQNDPPPAAPHCVDLRRIDRTETVGNRDILFHMKDGSIYRNELPHTCPGLARDEPFMYRLVLSQLCDTDVITMLQRWNFGFTPTESCMLGKFRLIDDQEAGALREAAKTKGASGQR